MDKNFEKMPKGMGEPPMGMSPMGMPPMGGPGFPPMGPPDGKMPEMPLMDVSHIKNKVLDLSFDDRYEQTKMDIYYPDEGEGPFPVLLHIHGGGFALGDKRDFHIAELLDAINRGYVFASCNYRRSGDAQFPAAVIDCRKCVDYLHKHAAELKIDDSKICAYGGSAGGNISAIFAMNPKTFYGEEEEIDASVECAIDWFGPTAFAKMDEMARENGVSFADHDEPRSPESEYIGAPLQEADPKLLALANPITYINDGMKPMLMQHGTVDVLVPFGQSLLLKEAIEAKGLGGRIIWLPLEGADHDDPLFKCDQNMEIMWTFLDKYLKGIEPETPITEMKTPVGDGKSTGMKMFGIPGGMPPMGGPGLPPMGGMPSA